MDGILSLAAANLGSPIILSFVLGLAAALGRSDLSVPEAAAKALSIYLLFAIGFKGGASVAAHGLDARLGAAVLAGVVLSFGLPFLAFGLLRTLTRLSRTDAAAVAAHYGSISIVTFVAATSVLAERGIAAEGYMVAVAAAMEAPAILSALWIASRGGARPEAEPGLWREILLNGSIVLLVGSFAIGVITGEEGLARVDSFIVAPFQGGAVPLPARHGACGRARLAREARWRGGRSRGLRHPHAAGGRCPGTRVCTSDRALPWWGCAAHHAGGLVELYRRAGGDARGAA